MRVFVNDREFETDRVVVVRDNYFLDRAHGMTQVQMVITAAGFGCNVYSTNKALMGRRGGADALGGYWEYMVDIVSMAIARGEDGNTAIDQVEEDSTTIDQWEEDDDDSE